MSLKPLGNRLFVSRKEPKETVRGGILNPDNAKDKSQEARVISVGSDSRDEDRKRVPLAANRGDRILLGNYSGTEARIDGKECLIVSEDDVLTVLN